MYISENSGRHQELPPGVLNHTQQQKETVEAKSL